MSTIQKQNQNNVILPSYLEDNSSILKYFKNYSNKPISFYSNKYNVAVLAIKSHPSEFGLSKISHIRRLIKQDEFCIPDIYHRYDNKFGLQNYILLHLDSKLYNLFKRIIDHHHKRSFVQIDAEELFKIARSSIFSDIEENPGPFYTKCFYELQNKDERFHKINYKWDFHGKGLHTLKLELPVLKLSAQCSESSKILCEENCFKSLFKVLQINLNLSTNFSEIVPQSGLEMMQGDLKAQDSVIENTVLTHTQDQSIIEAVPPQVDDKFLSEDVFRDPSLVGVEYWVSRYVWNTSSIAEVRTFPKSLFTLESANSAIIKAFQVHAIYRAKGTITLKPTANKFNSGQLSVTWAPLWNTYSDRDSRLNVFSLSQLNTQYINACSNNEIKISFDFFYPMNFVSSNYTSQYAFENDIGSLIFVPLNPISIGETGTNECDINIFIHFDDLQFNGKIDQRINAQSGLQSTLMGLGKNFLSSQTGGVSDMAFSLYDSLANKNSSNGNADHPVDPSPGHFVIPQYVPSFSSTVNVVNPINSLGLDPTAQVQHSYPVEDDFLNICKVKGLFRRIEIKASDNPQVIAYWPNIPILGANEYEMVGELSARAVPPIGVVSSMFENYKGKVKYDFLMSMTDKHNIKLMIGVLPKSTFPNNIIDETYLRNSKFQELNFTDGNFSASYEAPYFGSKKWSRLPSNSLLNADCTSAAYAPSWVYIVSLNKLSYSAGVSPSIYLNVFMRAADDFELSVYKPSIFTPLAYSESGLSFLRAFNLPSVIEIFYNNTTRSPNDSSVILRGQGTGSIEVPFSNFSNLASCGLVRYRNETGQNVAVPGSSSQSYLMYYVDPTLFGKEIVWVAPLLDGQGLTPSLYQVLINFQNFSSTANFNALAAYLTSVRFSGNWSYHNEYRFYYFWSPLDPIPASSNTVRTQSGLEGRMSSFQDQVSGFSATDDRSWGLKDFGEDFRSILNLLKRPQDDWPIFITTKLVYPNAALRLKVAPFPIYDKRISSSDPRVLTNGGNMAVLLSGFTGFKGSLIYSLLFPPSLNAQVWVNYFPDAYTKESVTMFPISTRTPTLVPSAPKLYFNLSINSAVRFRIPYYSCSEFILTNHVETGFTDDEAMINSMGSLTLGLDVNDVATLPSSFKVSMLKSFGDDAGLYFFRGFPPMYFFSEMGVQSNNINIARNSSMADIEENPGPSVPVVTPVTKYLTGGILAGISGAVSDSFCEHLELIKETINVAFEKFSQKHGVDFNLNNVLPELITQAGHCIINPSWDTILWSFGSFMCKVGLFGFSTIPRLVNCFLKFLKNFAWFSSQPSNDDQVRPQNENYFIKEDDSALFSYITILSTGIASLFGIAHGKMYHKSDSLNFIKIFKESISLGNSLSTFLKANGALLASLINRAYNYALSLSPEGILLNKLIVTDKFVGKWIKEVDFLTDKNNTVNIHSEPALQVRVRVAYLLGREFNRKLILGKDRSSSLLNNYWKRMEDCYSELASNGWINHVKREPFVIYNYGPTAIGKSQMASNLSAFLLSQLKIKFNGEMMYTVSPVSQFSSGLNNQPVIYIDDFLAVNTETAIQTQFDLLYSVATCATWRSVQAALEEKKKVAQPEILYLNSNMQCINHDKITALSAANRRLYFKINSELSDEMREAGHKSASTIPEHILETFSHLKFRLQTNPGDYRTPLFTDWMNYEQLKQRCLESFTNFRLRAERSVMRRTIDESQTKGLPLSNVTYDNLQDETFISDKIREFLSVEDTEQEDRGILSPSFVNSVSSLRTMVQKSVPTCLEIFDKFYCSAQERLFGFVSNTVVPIRDNEVTPQNNISRLDFIYQGPSAKRFEEFRKEISLYVRDGVEFLDSVDEDIEEDLFDSHELYNDPVSCYIQRLMYYNTINPFTYAYECECSWYHYNEGLECDMSFCLTKKFHNFPSISIEKKETAISEVITKIKLYVKAALDKIKKFFDDHKEAKYLVGLITFVTASSGIYSLVSNLISMKKGVFPQNHYDLVRNSKVVKANRVNMSIFQNKITPQSNELNARVAKVRKNLRYIVMLSPEEKVKDDPMISILACLGICNRKVLILKHYLKTIFEAFDSGQEVFFSKGDNKTNLLLNKTDFDESQISWRLTNDSFSELGVWDAPAKIDAMPNIINHFVTEDKFSYNSDKAYVMSNISSRPDVNTNFRRFQFKEGDLLHKYNHLISYENYSQNGFCGSIIFSANLNAPIGFHAFGNDGTKDGFAELIFRDNFKEFEVNETLIVEPISPYMTKLEPISDKDIRDYPSQITLLGKVPHYQVKVQSSGTQILASPLFNKIFPNRKEPAPLSPYDKRVNNDWSPLAEGIKKHGDPPYGFNPIHLEVAAEDTLRVLLQNCKPRRAQVSELSIEEAIIGIPCLEFKSLDLNTSPGYPLLALKNKQQKGKRQFIHTHLEDGKQILDGIDPVLSWLLEVEREKRTRQECVFAPAIDCLKDELLKTEKARKRGGTRVFSVSPVQQVIAGKRLFGDWLMAYRHNWLDLEHGISINPESSDWMVLAVRLQRFPNILEGDFSNFGPQADSAVALAAFNNIIAWYKHHGITDEHFSQILTLREEFVNGIHLCNNIVYSTHSGIISGSFATAEINSEINKIYMRLAWIGIMNRDMVSFHNNVSLFTYGDDIIACVSDDCISKFNVKSIGDFLGTYNIKFTNASKSLELISHVKLENATFLKRGFRFDADVPNQCLANLDKISIEEQINWIKSGGDPWDLLFQSIDSMLRSASMWGKKYYDELKEKINIELIRQNKNYVFKSFDILINEIYNNNSSGDLIATNKFFKN